MSDDEETPTLELPPEFGAVSLLDAAAHGSVTQVEELLRKGANVRIRDADGVTPLHMAVASDSVECVELLIAAGADVNDTDKCNRSALHFAAAHATVPVCRILVTAGAELNINTHRSVEEERDLAARSTTFGMVKSVLSVPFKCFNRKPPPSYGILRPPANKRTAYLPGQTPLHFAAIHDNINVARYLVENGANTRIVDEDGNFAASLASPQVATTIRVASMFQPFLAKR